MAATSSAETRHDGRSFAFHSRATRSRKHRVIKGVLCSVFGLLLFIPAVFVNTPIGYLPVLSYLFLLLLSFAYVQVLKRALEFSSQRAGLECVRSESIGFKLVVKNSSFLPAVRVQALFYMSDLFGGEGATDIHNITLGPSRSKTFNFDIRFDHIGTYKVGVREVTVLDPFGIFSSVQANDRLAEVNVLPRIFDVSNVSVSKDATLEAKKSFTSVINDGVDYSGVREYRWGDPIKIIHWKLSARATHGEYFTRLYETNANPSLAIIADFDAPAYGTEELMGIYDAVVECAFSLERFAVTHGYDAELVFEDGAKQRRRYVTPIEGRRQELLDRMPKIFSPGTGRDALSLVRDELGSPFAQANLILCTSVISRELVSVLVAAKAGKRSPILFAIVPETVEGDERKVLLEPLRQLDGAGISYAVISSAAVLEQGN